MWLIGVPQFVSFVCVCVCVCVCGVGEWGGVVPKHPCFLTHLNNEPDIAMSYLYREVPALLFYFGGSAKLRFRYISIYIYVVITYFCMFKFYFDYLSALSIVFYYRKLNFKT